MEAQVDAVRPRLLFVDDEQRVLNSMRIMFRRQFDLFLASHGAEALDIVKDKDIDVIVADHRMPKMTGVEVLSKVRTMSPRTVRILLTGYADLDAVEGSINDSEVFRFLTKPCAPKQLRETIELAAKLAREAPAPDVQDTLSPEDTLEIVMESDTVKEITSQNRAAAVPAAATAHKEDRASSTDIMQAPQFPPAADAAAAEPSKRLATGLGIVVFSSDNDVIDNVQKAVRGRLPVYNAGNIVHVIKIIDEHRPGVLVTDVSEDKATIQSMTARLKEHLPQLVTIAVSQHRDVLDMVWLINHGQIFRFLRKPLSAGRCAISLQAALQHHRLLLKNPELIKRHEVDPSATGDSGIVEGMLSKLKSMKRLWGNA
ncbi:MAG TPA: response regulator [Gammaproteobacteria bacterium]|nr:response regulator [Gammaproteobacteria bacterium]